MSPLSIRSMDHMRVCVCVCVCVPNSVQYPLCMLYESACRKLMSVCVSGSPKPDAAPVRLLSKCDRDSSALDGCHMQTCRKQPISQLQCPLGPPFEIALCASPGSQLMGIPQQLARPNCLEFYCGMRLKTHSPSTTLRVETPSPNPSQHFR
jgi:hypothetical protein